MQHSGSAFCAKQTLRLAASSGTGFSTLQCKAACPLNSTLYHVNAACCNKCLVTWSQPHLCASIVKDARFGLVGLDRCHIDDGTALAHVLDSKLSNCEVCQDVGVEGSFQPLAAYLLKFVDLFVLEGSIID